MQPRQDLFEVREEYLTTITQLTNSNNIPINGQRTRTTSTYLDSGAFVALLLEKLEASNSEAMQLRQDLQSTNQLLQSSQQSLHISQRTALTTGQALQATQQSLHATQAALNASRQALDIVQKVSTSTVERLTAENRNLQSKLSLFKQQPVQAIVLSPTTSAVNDASTTGLSIFRNE